MSTRILVPLDGSQLAEAILPYVEELAHGMDAEIVLLRVVVPILVCDDVRTAHAVDTQFLLAEATDYMTVVASRLKSRGLRVECVIRFGDAARQLLRFAKEADVALIAMSTRRRSRLSRWVLGSVTDRVLGAWAKPVLLIESREASRSPAVQVTLGRRRG